MGYSSPVEKWRPWALQELTRQKIPLPVELILSVMARESAGKIGDVNPKSGASGLMQIMPVALADYNQRHGTSYTMADMRGEDELSGRKQVEVGIGTIGHFWKSAFKYLSSRYGQIPVPVDELAPIADLYYAAGPKPVIKRLNQIGPPFWPNVQTAFPEWNALPHPRHVLKEPKPWNLSAIDAWLGEPSKKKWINIPENPETGFAIGVLILCAAFYFIGGKKGK